MKKIILLTFILLMSSCGKYPVWYEEKTADQAAIAGWLNFSQDLLAKSEVNFLEAISLDSTNISANIGLGWVRVLKDSGDLAAAAINFEFGLLNSTWKYDALGGLCVVKAILNEYPLTISLADLLLSAKPLYVFKYKPDIDWHDIYLLKIQAQYFTGEYKRAWSSVLKITSKYTLDPDETETWVVNGRKYITFESALAKVIEELTELYSF